MHPIARTVPSIVRSFMPVLKKSLLIGVIDTIFLMALFFIKFFSDGRLPLDHWLKKTIDLRASTIRTAIIAILFKNDFSSFMKNPAGILFVVSNIFSPFELWWMTGRTGFFFEHRVQILRSSHGFITCAVLLGLYLKDLPSLVKKPFFYQVTVVDFMQSILLKKLRPLMIRLKCSGYL